MRKMWSFPLVLALLLSVGYVQAAGAITKLVIEERALKNPPAAEEKADFRTYAESKFNDLREYGQGKPTGYGTAQAVIDDAESTITLSKQFGVRVSDLKAQLPELKKKAYRSFAEKKTEALRAYGANESSGYLTAELVISDTEKAIVKAKKSGAKVSDLQVRLPELKKKAYRSFAERKFGDLYEFGQGKPSSYGTAGAVISDAEKAIARAQKSGAKVSDLQSQLPELKRKAKARSKPGTYKPKGISASTWGQSRT